MSLTTYAKCDRCTRSEHAQVTADNPLPDGWVNITIPGVRSTDLCRQCETALDEFLSTPPGDVPTIGTLYARASDIAAVTRAIGRPVVGLS